MGEGGGQQCNTTNNLRGEWTAGEEEEQREQRPTTTINLDGAWTVGKEELGLRERSAIAGTGREGSVEGEGCSSEHTTTILWRRQTVGKEEEGEAGRRSSIKQQSTSGGHGRQGRRINSRGIQ